MDIEYLIIDGALYKFVSEDISVLDRLKETAKEPKNTKKKNITFLDYVVEMEKAASAGEPSREQISNHCPSHFGIQHDSWENDCDGDCGRCWHRPYDERYKIPYFAEVF